MTLLDRLKDPSQFSSMVGAGAAGAGMLGSMLDANHPTAVGGGLKGAAAGAQLGMSFGPLGAGIGAGVGALAGTLTGIAGAKSFHRAEDTANAQKQFLLMQNQQDEATGLGTAKGYYAMGGHLSRAMLVRGGKLKPLSSMSVEVEGPSHEGGGVQVPGAEVEGGETISNGDYVFSKRLGFADAHKRLMKPLEKIESKPPTPERLNSTRDILKQQEELKIKQELLKRFIHGPTS